MRNYRDTKTHITNLKTTRNRNTDLYIFTWTMPVFSTKKQ